MRVNESVLVWKPGTDKVANFRNSDYRLESTHNEMHCSGLGAYTHIRNMDFKDRKMMCFITAMHLIVRDKVDPMAVHNALLVLDEYRDGCADDMPGICRDGQHPKPLTCEEAFEIEPRLRDLEWDVIAFMKEHKWKRHQRNHAWYHMFKPRMLKLVGDGADQSELGTSEIYDTMYFHYIKLLKLN